MSYDAPGSGHLSTHDRWEEMWKKSNNIQKRWGADRATPFEERHGFEAPEFEDGRSYTRRELEAMADVMVEGFEDVLSRSQLASRLRREIYVTSGIPDPHKVSGLYWRTHPEGRTVNSDEQRQRNGAGFYR